LPHKKKMGQSIAIGEAKPGESRIYRNSKIPINEPLKDTAFGCATQDVRKILLSL